MNYDIFEALNFNIIEDEEYYYVFRALEDCDIDDENNNKISKDNGIYKKLRTYRERYNETHSIESRYKENDEISLDEVYSHIKKNFYPGTNCISFSTNCNVSLDYGYGLDKYVMIAVPKNNRGYIYDAGKYMIEELDKYLEQVISKLVNQNELINTIRKIETLNNNDDVIREVSNQINNYNYKSNDNISQRFQSKQFFNEEQQLTYNKLLAKLTLLEASGNVGNVLSRTSSNASLLSTISMAYSSGEVINYGDNFTSNIIPVSKTSIELFAILQQAEDMGFDKEKIDKLKKRVLTYAKDGFEFRRYNNDILGYGNNDRYIPYNSGVSNLLENDDTVISDEDIKIEDTFYLTEGKISYYKTKQALKFAKNLAYAKEKSYELSNILKSIATGLGMDDLIEEISKKTYAVNANIINRRNGSGLKICESVNIDMNPDYIKLYSNDEQEKMISYITNMDRASLRELVYTNGLSIERDLCDNILESTNRKNINRYVAEAIVDEIDFDNIYNKTTSDREITSSEKELIVSRLENVNCLNLYNAFKKNNLSNKDISGYITNLLLDNGYKDYTLNQLSNLDNLNDLITTNLSNLNKDIPAIRLDRLFGIHDNYNSVAGTYINLRDYQMDTVNSIDAVWNDKRFAGVVLPTGGGKSFVTIAQMIKYKNSNIIYYAPNQAILIQFAEHILKYVLGLSTDEVNYLFSLNESANKGEFLPRNVSNLLKEAFPHLKLYCYQGLMTKDDDILESYDADLIIFDELHRTGANEWNTRVRKLVNLNPNAKLLGLTATPIRDADRVDMMRKFAELSHDYSKTEIVQKKYLATEMYSIDAMQDGILVEPNIITFDYTLDETDEYKEVKSMYEKETDPKKKEEYKKIYDEMKSIVEKSKDLGMSKIILDAFKNNNKRMNGRYIVFLPRNNNSNITSEEYIKQKMEEVKEYFSGVDQNPEMSYLLSNRENLKENAIALSKLKEDSEHLRLIFAIDMLNEGVHPDGIDGEVMLRPISANSKILYNQQTGRVLFSLDPSITLSESKTPIIFDVYNNYLEQNMDREVNKTNSTSDLQKMRSAVSWIMKHHRFPDINSMDVIEYRKAKTLKKIQAKYTKYLTDSFGNNLSPSEQYEIEEILRLGHMRIVNLWDRDIPDRTVVNDTISKDVERVNAFKLTGEQKKFMELYKNAKSISKKPMAGAARIKHAISVLEILSEYGVNINNDTIRLTSKLEEVLKYVPEQLLDAVKEELQEPLDYNIGKDYEYLKDMFYSGHKSFLNYDIKTLRSTGIFQEFYRGNRLYKSVDDRGFIVKSCSELLKVNIYTGTYYDLNSYDFEGFDEMHFREGEGVYNEYGFDRNGIHNKTHTNLDPHGFDVYGDYYELGENGEYINKGKYDNFGFAINGLYYEEMYNERTGKTIRSKIGKIRDCDGYNIDGLDVHLFDRNGINVETNTNLDLRGFDRECYYYELDQNGEYVNTNNKFDRYGFNIDKIYLDGTKYDRRGFDVDAIYHPLVFINGKTVRTDGDKYYNEIYFDRDGYYWRLDESGERVKSNNPYNELFYDIDGFYWKMLNDGTREKTNYKYDDRGFYESGINKDTHEYWNIYGLDVNNSYDTIVKMKYFGRDGNFWEKQEDGTYKKVDKLNEHYFDRDGNFWELQSDGTFSKKGLYNDGGFDSDLNYHALKPSGKRSYIASGKYNPKGYDIDGYNRLGFNENHIHRDTGTILNPEYFDYQGYYYIVDDSGNYINTHRKYNDKNINIYGEYVEVKQLSSSQDIEITTKYIDIMLNLSARSEVYSLISKYYSIDINDKKACEIKLRQILTEVLNDNKELKDNFKNKLAKLRYMVDMKKQEVSKLDLRINGNKEKKAKLEHQIDVYNAYINKHSYLR